MSNAHKIGSIYKCSTGYDCTINHYYQVVGHFGKTGVVLAELEKEHNDEKYSRAIKNAFTGKETRARITKKGLTYKGVAFYEVEDEQKFDYELLTPPYYG